MSAAKQMASGTVSESAVKVLHIPFQSVKEKQSLPPAAFSERTLQIGFYKPSQATVQEINQAESNTNLIQLSKG